MDKNRQHVNEQFKSSYKGEYHERTLRLVLCITMIPYHQL